MSLKGGIKFQKALALAASASNQFEMEAAELAARRLMEAYQIDPTDIPNGSLYSRINFRDNALLAKLRAEWREQHPPPAPKEHRQVEVRRPEGCMSIPFSINGYRKHAREFNKRRSPQKLAEVEVTDEMLSKIHIMLKDGVAPVKVRRTFGLTRGQIAGIKGRYDESLRAANVQTSRNQQAAPAPAGDADDSSTGQA